MVLQARPTDYAGIHMRSRLEATVASNLDGLGVRWSYEPRAFGGPGMQQWLPDFRFETGPVADPKVHYLEVKGTLTGRESEGGSTARRRLLMTRMAVAWESEPDAVLVIAEHNWRFNERNPGNPSVWAATRGVGWTVAGVAQCSGCRTVRLLPIVSREGEAKPGAAWRKACHDYSVEPRSGRWVDLLKRVV